LAQTDAEARRVWEHLSFANIIPEQFRYDRSDEDISFPQLVLDKRVYYNLQYTDESDFTPAHYLWLQPLTSSYAFIDVTDFAKMDKKLDDGKASSGNFVAASTCVNVSTLDYDLQAGKVPCTAGLKVR
jgi:hypothetical protein